MTVTDLQRHLQDLGRLLEAAGVKGAVPADLHAIQAALAPFAGWQLKAFADFLTRAEGYWRGGEVPQKARAPRQPRAAAPKKAAADPAEAAQNLRQLYDRAADPALTIDHIDGELAALNGMSKPSLAKVAEALELKGMSRKKADEIRSAVRQRILDRKGAAQRTAMVDPLPASPR